MNGQAMQQICVCADDFALTEGVSRGILDLTDQGRITATSAIVTLPRWRVDAVHAVRVRAHADLGLHFNLTLGAPLGPMPGLAPAGRLPAIGAVIRAALARRLDAREVEAEAARQLQAFGEATGTPPDFVDGHQHVHALPVVREGLLAALARVFPGQPIALRDPADRPDRILARPVERAKALVVTGLATGFGATARRRGHPTNAGFSGFSDFSPDVDMEAVMRAALTARGRRHLVMVHPGHVDAELAMLDPAVESRAREFAYLSSDAWPALLGQQGLTLARFTALAGR